MGYWFLGILALVVIVAIALAFIIAAEMDEYIDRDHRDHDPMR